MKIHGYTKPVLDSVASLSFGTCLCVTHSSGALEAKPANKDRGIKKGLTYVIDSRRERKAQLLLFLMLL